MLQRFRRRGPLVWALCLLVWLVPRGASAQYRIDSWTTEHGLPQNSVNSILQTRDGFLWLATFGGLVRFDGATFHAFTTVNAPGMRTSRLVALFESDDGALWASTDAGGAVRYRAGAFATYTTADGLPHNTVHSFYSEKGQLVAETERGMARWDGTRFVPYATPRPGAEDARRAVIARSPSGVIWYRDAGGLHRFEHGRVTRSVPGLHPRRGFEDRSGRLWIETQDRSLASLSGAGLRIYTEADGVPRLSTVTASEDREGNIWFGLRANGGLLRYDGARFTRYTTADGLPSDNVGLVYHDREGTRWVPTEGGLARLTIRSITSYSSANGLAADNTYPIFQDRHGDVWIGGWPGLTRHRDGIFESMAARFGLAGENMMAFAEGRDGALWIGTWGGGVRRILDGQVTAFSGNSGGPGTVVRAILPSRGSDIWFGGTSGLFRFRDGAFATFDRSSGYKVGDVHALHEDRHGALWVGSNSGLTRLRDGIFTHFAEKDGLAGTVRAIHEDRDGTLWLGTYDSGLFRFRDGRFTRYTTREGLFTNGAFQIIEDERGRFWISSNVGIYRVARKDLDALAEGRISEVVSVPYGRRDGMLQTECNGGGQPAGIRARDGRIWFPTQKGIAVFDPNAVPVDTQPPPVVITNLLVAEQPVPLRDRIEIRGESRTLEVQYAALTFVRPELTRFRYRVEGLDTRWIDAGQQRTARFAQLPYGAFDFHVIAANRDGVWNEQGARVRIVVIPPFWRTRWFLALVIAGVSMIALAGHRWRIAHLRAQQALREAFSRQLIDSQESDRKRIAAGLHDGLSQSLIVMRNWALLGQKSLPIDHSARERLGEIEETAALALGEVRDVVHDLAPHNLERLGLAQTVEEMVERVDGSSDIRFKCRLAKLDGRLSKAAEINLYRVLQEAVNNVVKHSGAARAWIELDVDGPVLRAAVRDDGRGFDGNGSRPLGKGGFGLFGMSERLRMIGGRMSIESAPGQGTTVMIELPLGEAS